MATSSIGFIDTVALAAVILCWIAFLVPFLFRKRPPADATEHRRDRMSLVGITIQGAGYAVVWSMRRPDGAGFVPLGFWWRVAFDAVAVIAASWAVWLAIAAVIVLGKQWSITARVLSDHVLATEGPYGIVRHPIYTGMILMAIATGIVVSDWRWTILAVALAAAGALIRVRIEERLLVEAFGDTYRSYARRVPALFPRPTFGR